LLRNHTTTTNFTSGILTYATNSISGTGWSVEVLPDGWYRCIYVSQISDVINVGDTLYGYAHFNGASFTAGDTAYLWGAQIEAGSTATTYRPTTSTLESAANANIPGFSSAGYTLFADGRFDTQHGVSVDALRLQTDANNYVRLNLNSSNNVSMFSYVSSAVTGISTTVAAGVARNKLAGSFVANQFYFAVNGASKTNTSGALPAAPTTLFIGNPTQFNGFIFRAGIVPVALTQAQINGLTS
jgi:hypothetical protein